MKTPRIRLGTLLLLVVIAALAIALYADRRRAAHAEANRQRRAALDIEFATWTVHSRIWTDYAAAIEATSAEVARGEPYAGSWSISGVDPAEATGLLNLETKPGDSVTRLREIARLAREAAARCDRQAERCVAERKALPDGR